MIQMLLYTCQQDRYEKERIQKNGNKRKEKQQEKREINQIFS